MASQAPTAPPPRETYDTALNAAIRQGWMSGNQYRYLAEELRAAANCSLLVFGAGHDSLLWSQCTSGDLAFVEDNPKYLSLAPVSSRVVLYQYASRVGQWLPVPSVPPLVDQPWDFILVDGPTGFGHDQPGRQFSIAWARQLATRRVFVHDYERSWERAVCDKMLGTPIEVIPSDGSKAGDLGVFDVGPAN